MSLNFPSTASDLTEELEINTPNCMCDLYFCASITPVIVKIPQLEGVVSPSTFRWLKPRLVNSTVFPMGSSPLNNRWAISVVIIMDWGKDKAFCLFPFSNSKLNTLKKEASAKKPRISVALC